MFLLKRVLVLPRHKPSCPDKALWHSRSLFNSIQDFIPDSGAKAEVHITYLHVDIDNEQE